MPNKTFRADSHARVWLTIMNYRDTENVQSDAMLGSSSNAKRYKD